MGPKSQTGGLVTAWPCGSVVALILYPPQECECRPTARPRGALFPPAAKCNFMQRAGKRLRPRTDLFPACHAVINGWVHMPCAARPCFRLLPGIAAISCASISACIHPSRVQPLTAPSGSSAFVSCCPRLHPLEAKCCPSSSRRLVGSRLSSWMSAGGDSRGETGLF